MAMLDPTSPRPLYLQLADHLRRQIDTGAWQANTRLPPEVELAVQFTVSRGTVRQAMDLLVHQGLLQRTPGKGTFVTAPNPHGRSQLIGMVVPYLHDSLTTDILCGAESVLRRNGYSLIFCHSEGDLQLEQAQIERLQREGIAGLILFPVAAVGESSILMHMLRPQLPVVIIDRRVPRVSASYVVADNRSGAYQAVQHLIALGHKRIVCISLPERPSSIEERIRGYEQALRDSRLLPLAAVPLAIGRHTAQDGVPHYTAEELAPIDQLLGVHEPPSALFCVNDFIALGVMQHILARGHRVPHDIAIAGFDDIAIAPYMPVPLTTVAQPTYEIGAHAAQLLLDQIAGVVDAQREIVLPTTLIVRASTSQPVAIPASAAAIPHPPR
jgi:DNA-binding LacI/PurR family transcriptional regulator